MSAVPHTRQNTTITAILPLGRAVHSMMTYDLSDTLRRQNREERCAAHEGNPSDSSSEDPPTSGSEEEGGPMLDLHYIWDEKPCKFRAARKAYAKDTTPKRAWTDVERLRTDIFLPHDRLYEYTELVGPSGEMGFDLLQWEPRYVRPVVDRVGLVIAVVTGMADDIEDGCSLLKNASRALEHSALLSSVRTNAGPDDSHSISVGLRYESDHATNLPSTNIRDELALDHLKRHVAIERVVAYTTSLFASFALPCFNLAASRAETAFNADPTLVRLFPGAWTNIIFDLGCNPTRKSSRSQLRWSWLAITTLGSFDHTCSTTILLPGILRYSFAKDSWTPTSMSGLPLPCADGDQLPPARKVIFTGLPSTIISHKQGPKKVTSIRAACNDATSSTSGLSSRAAQNDATSSASGLSPALISLLRDPLPHLCAPTWPLVNQADSYTACRQHNVDRINAQRVEVAVAPPQLRIRRRSTLAETGSRTHARTPPPVYDQFDFAG
ncbi:hypothetical protein B0H17DRAFT_1211180 [Mycena rosella]|uniref:Uncharacterized protein n=1 Tax=Mycena rosella TaxID=1033263 RepID=A0AAD7CUQ0_MYCRO|nr:hypothetical protein B0H17DRAFT_1211180 [Mycena rosella]